MRNHLSKLGAGSMLVAAALAVSACGHKSDANSTADTNMTDMNTMDSSAGMSNDASAMDATGNDANMAMDNGASDAGSNGSNAM